MSKNNTETMQPETKEADSMKLDVHVRHITPVGNLLAFASVTINDSFVVDGLRICSGEKGLYVNMPSAQDKNGTWRDTFKPITADARHQLVGAVLEGYNTSIEKMQAALDASRGAAEKPSVTGSLKENAGKVQNQPAKNAPAKEGQSR